MPSTTEIHDAEWSHRCALLPRVCVVLLCQFELFVAELAFRADQRPATTLGTCAIHQQVFGDICDRAGELRTVAIAKGSWFCLPQYIDSSAAEVGRRSTARASCRAPAKGRAGA